MYTTKENLLLLSEDISPSPKNPRIYAKITYTDMYETTMSFLREYEPDSGTLKHHVMCNIISTLRSIQFESYEDFITEVQVLVSEHVMDGNLFFPRVYQYEEEDDDDKYEPWWTEEDRKKCMEGYPAMWEDDEDLD